MPRAPLLLVALAVAAPLTAQSSLERSPNLGGTWVAVPGVVQFNFVHRFYVSSGSNTVVNYPTFTFAVGLTRDLTIGDRFSTHSETPSGLTNEAEFYARWRRRVGAVAVAVTPAYNAAAKSLDGEVGVDWTSGRLTVSGAARGMSHAYGVSRARTALAGGAVWRLNDYVALAGDVASLVSRDSTEAAAWSAGILFVIPGSPHTFSLHASNVAVNTIEGSSRRGLALAQIGKPLYGFEFTIPLHLKRFAPWFGGSSGARRALPSAAAAGVAADVRMKTYSFAADSITIRAGAAVRWINDDPVEHTVTFDNGEPGSPLIPTNGFFIHRFAQPGRYSYHCTPHPYMKGVVVVR